MIDYVLHEGFPAPAPGKCTAQVLNARSYTQEQIVDQMMERGTTLPRADIAATVQLYTEVCSDLTEDGASLNTPLFNTSASIGGVFNGAADSFDPSRHSVKLNLMPGTALKAAAAKAKPNKVEGTGTDPYIVRVVDRTTGKANCEVRPGSVMELTGARLKFDASDEAQGVFVIGPSGEMRCSTVIENEPFRVMVLLSGDIVPGDFILEVRTRHAKSGDLKVGRFGRILSMVFS